MQFTQNLQHSYVGLRLDSCDMENETIQSDVASQMPQTLMLMVFEIHKWFLKYPKW